MTDLTSQQILELAPDSASAKAGEGLARRDKWQTLGYDSAAVWGECQGSGKNPYQTQVALDGPTFRCSCPSRKFPCKHGLALMLLHSRDRSHFGQGEQPDWVSSWLAGRSQRAEARQAKAQQPVDPAAQQKRQQQREERVERGIEEFRVWLDDLVRTGFAQARNQRYAYWDDAAARLIDAQAPGLAALVRALPESFSRPDWQAALLTALSRLHLLLEAYSRLDQLPEALHHDIRQQIGWPLDVQALSSQDGERGHWLVLGSRIEQQEIVRERRTWLRHADGRLALLLDFAPLSQSLAPGWPPGQWLDAELVFAPSAVPLRAVLKQANSLSSHSAPLPDGDDAATIHGDFASQRSALPWLRRRAYCLEATPVEQDGIWSLRDRQGQLLPLALPWNRNPWHLLVRSRGRRLWISGEWDGEAFRPLSSREAQGWFGLSEDEV
ncbi:SWIM zinc finger family protein [Chitinimonas lacunae]|uniref:SWIM zinc finger domain-containing protein n=1 Tax=Chitinimonas lacunae TaxID=1963018 RepID=A0ABV8MQK8_9NEIS